MDLRQHNKRFYDESEKLITELTRYKMKEREDWLKHEILRIVPQFVFNASLKFKSQIPLKIFGVNIDILYMQGDFDNPPKEQYIIRQFGKIKSVRIFKSASFFDKSFSFSKEKENF